MYEQDQEALEELPECANDLSFNLLRAQLGVQGFHPVRLPFGASVDIDGLDDAFDSDDEDEFDED